MVAAVFRATMLLPPLLLLLLLRKHSSRVHKQTDKTRGGGGGECVRGAERDSGGTVAIRLSKYLTISLVALCTAGERGCVNGYVTIIQLTMELRAKAKWEKDEKAER